MLTERAGGFINFIILLCGIIMMACILANKLSSRLGVPVLLLFILLGIVFGSDGLFKIQFDNYEITESLSSAPWMNSVSVPITAKLLSCRQIRKSADRRRKF